ncbi:ATP-binding cassette domain-containing protein [Crocinitomicaceae bacterium]|nr:ATP-binding cassette domain-containing protein [Crocinitomicaceae bacterium]MDC0100676.1 ATP-binding cassette domain-containing protein [Crocinitomicaceae bacterium]MDC1282695.1 ATP-binding cassette domain-containing protein [Crocinitomicaceae bacterium]MDC1384557.1 ATP-binding cassette domain-containing protein [Crocinitomicaceae bacterium]|tara:strand:- start:6230 stop:7147 length:918 start_codon:yes stop_codon:yes gene_type:complete
MIELQNIGVKREDWVLRNVNLSIAQGELIGIIGQSGIGKTTLLKLISGLVDVSEGEVRFQGVKLIGPSEKLIPGYEEIQLVNQDFGLEPYHTVWQNVKEKVLNLNQEDQDLVVTEFLELVELKHLKNRKAIVLSGGEQQRLAIARALACEPKVLLLDEPFVHIDQRLRLKIVNYLLTLNKVRNTTIVLVSHDGAEVMGFVKKVVHIAAEGIERIDSIENMFYHPATFEQGQLMGWINQIELEGEKVLFRPNEYAIVESGIELSFTNFLDTGISVFNYFKTAKGEDIVLISMAPLNQVKSINIKRK